MRKKATEVIRKQMKFKKYQQKLKEVKQVKGNEKQLK